MLQAQAALAGMSARAQVGLLRAEAALAVSVGELDRVPPEPLGASQDPADQLYRDARAALNRESYSRAAELFGQLYTKYPRSSYAGDAYYWQAYAYYKRGNDQSLKRALEVLKLQREKSPSASTRGEAETLAARIQGQLARSGDAEAAEAVTAIATRAAMPLPPVPPVAGTPPIPPSVGIAPLPPGSTRRYRGSRDACASEDDIQTAALNALQQMDASKALPILKKVLARRDEGSLCLRRKAMFIVSQQQGVEAEQILLDAARSDPDAEVREQAVFWLSQVNSPTAVLALDSILRSAADPVLQDKAIFALSQQNSTRARQALRDFALRSGVSDELREKAIFWIGQSADPDRLAFLKTLYGQLKSEELREKILFSISQNESKDSSPWLLSVAADVNESIELRKKALFWVGQSDYPLSELATLYDRMPNREMKEQLIFVYSQRNEKAAVDRLMQIARTEPDRELKKKAIFWLSQSSDSRVPEFLASLLEKP
jgi:tetratricopeptide (TPR) repeat protein